MNVRIENLTRRYAATLALDALSYAADGRRTLVLIGPSGGGKSTLLRILGGLEPADGGFVEINGHHPGHTNPEQLAYRRRNGFLFQQFNLFPHLTAFQNVALPLRAVHGRTGAAARSAAEQCLDRFGLLDHAHKHPGQLSGGQQQRVAIARAFAARPEILFLDEPTSALDPEMTAEVLELIQELAEGGQDIILSTHEMGFARAVADDVVFIAEGKVAESGPPSAVFGSPRSAICQRFLSKVMRY